MNNKETVQHNKLIEKATEKGKPTQLTKQEMNNKETNQHNRLKETTQ